MLGTLAAGAQGAGEVAKAAGGGPENNSIGPTTTTSGVGARDINIMTGGGSSLSVPWWGWALLATATAVIGYKVVKS
jgi:hypothetical protein